MGNRVFELQGYAIVLDKVVFLTRDPKTDELIAMSGECTHVGCPVQKKQISKEGKTGPLSCPCHDGLFSRTGEVIYGPPPRPLRRLKLDALPKEADGDIYVLEV